MEILCPNCSSRFNLPDDRVKPGAKLRCSVCKTVFPLSLEPAAPPPDKLPVVAQKKGPARRKLWLALALLVLCLGAGGGYWYVAIFNAAPPLSEQEISQKVKMLTMRNVRQYYVENEKVGKVVVIEGRVVNEFPEPKALITMEAAIYDRDKKTLATKRQLAGTQLSLFQLQVLGEKEMESFLFNKMDILTNNTNVPHGGEVPFMILFYKPENVAEFGVRIVDVKDVADQNLE